ncbi:hypothetical protein [Burkholderia multivorans]|uniref:hypothetical protein n=1 Tax=Burkholderia multivorans TaxID=87883 RepID=UPI000AD2503B|nr:hypothetical protein [Burkholderia multivorans]
MLRRNIRHAVTGFAGVLSAPCITADYNTRADIVSKKSRPPARINAHADHRRDNPARTTRLPPRIDTRCCTCTSPPAKRATDVACRLSIGAAI